MSCRVCLPFLCLLLTCGPALLMAQACDCPATFRWVVKTFSENDAGYTYALEEKGREAYDAMLAETTAAADTVTQLSNCSAPIAGYLGWFRPGHWGIRYLGEGTQGTPAPVSDDSLRARYADWPRIEGDLAKLEEELLRSDDPFEGVWLAGDYRIGVQQQEDGRYLGAILAADSTYWVPGQVKLEWTPDSSLTYYMQDHSPRYLSAPQLVGKNFVVADWVNLTRETPQPNDDPGVVRYRRASTTQGPYLERIDANTLYFRIPSFHQQQKPAIDSVIAAHRREILSTKNLILDIHSGTGGSDASYGELIPFLYTNPMHHHGVEYYSTALNNQRMLDFAEDTYGWGFSEEFKQWARESYPILQARQGEFVNLDSTTYEVERLDTVYPYPANVAILIDGGNGSTDEQFLLAAKQSRKVKLFGQSTFGVLDISNMYQVQDPCQQYELSYSLTRSFRIPGFAIDGIGIQPDIFIDDSVPKWEWVDFVRDVLAD